MLGLKLPTDPRWSILFETKLVKFLRSCHTEQKAATNAINIVIQFPEYPDLVDAMFELVSWKNQALFNKLHKKIMERGYTLATRKGQDEYVLNWIICIRKGHTKILYWMDKLLFSALIEARSCERFKVLSDNINDPDLKAFYRDLMISEANHYTCFWFLQKYTGKV